MGQLAIQSPDLMTDEVLGDGPYGPWTIEEFHGAFGFQYDLFLTNNLLGLRPVVYHTTVSNRNRNPGWYWEFKYNKRSIEEIAEPVATQDTSAEVKQPADYFWATLCEVKITDEERNSVSISIGHILVGKMILTHFKDLLGTNNVVLSPILMKQLYEKKISENHTLMDLWPDFDKFTNFVRSAMRKTFQWKSHPFSAMNKILQTKFLQKHQICHLYQIEGIGQGVDDELEEQIDLVLKERKLMPILKVGALAMNSQYVDFLFELRELYDREIALKCNEQTGSQKVASALRKELCKAGVVLP
jgi:hypothetical protein